MNTGIYALSPAVVARVEAGRAITMPELLRSVMADGGTIGAFEVEGDWVDVGQREQLARAREGA